MLLTPVYFHCEMRNVAGYECCTHYYVQRQVRRTIGRVELVDPLLAPVELVLKSNQIATPPPERYH